MQIIALAALLIVRDALDVPRPAEPLAGWRAAAAMLVPMGLIALITHLICMRSRRRLDRTGDVAAVSTADVAVSLARWAALACFAAGVWGAGWLEAVRHAIGDLPGVDEAVATLPPICVFMLGWWSKYPIERALHDAALMGDLDHGVPVAPFPGRVGYVLEQTRFQVLAALIPLAMLTAWSELVDFAVRLSSDRLNWPSDEGSTALAESIGQIAGVLGMTLLIPLLLAKLWGLVPLGAGAIRTRLEELARLQGVRFRDLLVWPTRTGMLNGALVGVFPGFRYIILTDGLLERLEPEHVEAVMAHEVAHARKHHLPWLLASALSAVGVTWIVAAAGLDAAMNALDPAWTQDHGTVALLDGAVLTAALAAGVLIFGFVNRRFEEQADAFAVQHLCGRTRAGEERRDIVIHAAGAEQMSGALAEVARLNGIPERRFTFRHGSIAGRRRKIAALVGRPAHELPIDRKVAVIKAMAGIGLAVVLAAGVAGG